MNRLETVETHKSRNLFIGAHGVESYSNLDFKSSDEVRTVQNTLLRSHLRYAAERSRFYGAVFNRASIAAEDILSVEDLSKLPCTTKEDLLGADTEFLACAPDEVADVCMTSATTGDSPSILLQSFSDLSRLAYNEEKAFSMMGITSADTVVVCAALDRSFMAGLAYYLGGLKLGARMVRAGAGSSGEQWRMIKATGATVIVGVPSFIRRVASYALNNGESPEKSGVRLLVAIGESIRDHELNLLGLAIRAEELWGAPIYSTYASTEMATAFCECSERSGGHLSAELVAVELLDDNGKPVPAGEKGEVVVTPLGVTGMPLIRFRTGDISFLIDSPCPCGRNTPRLGPVLGRKNQMLKYKGTTVFPSALVSTVEALESVAGVYVEAHKGIDASDQVSLYVALSDEKLALKAIEEHLRASVRVVPVIKIVSIDKYNKKVFNKGKRKRTTFFDLR